MNQGLNRATWIWKSEEVLCNDDQIKRFVDFARQNGINRVYIHINPDIPHQALANFTSLCNKTITSGIAVEALMGHPAWIHEPQAHQSLLTRLHWVEDYQRCYAHDVSVLLQGLHLDIEPWQLDGWHSADQPDLIRQWVSCIQHLRGWANAQDPPLPVAADLPFWLHTLQFPNSSERLDRSMMRVLDGAVFMTYRNSPQGLMDVSSEALLACRSCEKSMENIFLAVETVRSDEGSHISYHGLGRRRLREDVGRLESGHGLTNREPHGLRFGGLAIHDYDSWANMED